MSSVNLLILLPWDPVERKRYQDLLAPRYPQISFHSASSIDEANEKIKEADIFMAFGASVRRDIFANARRLKWVHAFGTGLDGIIDQAGLRPEVIVTSTRGIHGVPLSEMAILMMLSLARDFPRTVRAHDRHAWERWRARLLFGKKAGILGVGLIAADLAPRLKALGMDVTGITRTPRQLPGFDRFVPRDDLPKAVVDLDFLVLLLPLDRETHGIVNADVFAAMKRSSYLVNIARGAIIDEKALIDALNAGQIAGAALDAVIREPLPADDPLWTARNIMITPHIGGFYDMYPEDSLDQICTNIDCFLSGRFSEMVNREPR